MHSAHIIHSRQQGCLHVWSLKRPKSNYQIIFSHRHLRAPWCFCLPQYDKKIIMMITDNYTELTYIHQMRTTQAKSLNWQNMSVFSIIHALRAMHNNSWIFCIDEKQPFRNDKRWKLCVAKHPQYFLLERLLYWLVWHQIDVRVDYKPHHMRPLWQMTYYAYLRRQSSQLYMVSALVLIDKHMKHGVSHNDSVLWCAHMCLVHAPIVCA